MDSKKLANLSRCRGAVGRNRTLDSSRRRAFYGRFEKASRLRDEGLTACLSPKNRLIDYETGNLLNTAIKITIEDWNGGGAIRTPAAAPQELGVDVGDSVYLIEE